MILGCRWEEKYRKDGWHNFWKCLNFCGEIFALVKNFLFRTKCLAVFKVLFHARFFRFFCWHKCWYGAGEQFAIDISCERENGFSRISLNNTIHGVFVCSLLRFLRLVFFFIISIPSCILQSIPHTSIPSGEGFQKIFRC